MDKLLLAQLKLPGGDQVNAPEGIPTASGAGSIGGIISWVIIVLTAVGVIAALVFLIIGSIKWITSGGDVEKLQSARKTVMFSVIGLIVILLSVVIMQVVAGLLGVKVL